MEINPLSTLNYNRQLFHSTADISSLDIPRQTRVRTEKAIIFYASSERCDLSQGEFRRGSKKLRRIRFREVNELADGDISSHVFSHRKPQLAIQFVHRRTNLPHARYVEMRICAILTRYQLRSSLLLVGKQIEKQGDGCRCTSGSGKRDGATKRQAGR